MTRIPPPLVALRLTLTLTLRCAPEQKRGVSAYSLLGDIRYFMFGNGCEPIRRTEILSSEDMSRHKGGTIPDGAAG
jgi:hypothetical protein